jgi:disulfide bond formation protein DsbB
MPRSIINLVLRHWPLAALVASAAMLAIAHAFQTFGGLQPCMLCLQQRDAYWVAMAVSAVAIVAGRIPQTAGLVRWLVWILALVFLAGAAIAVRHAGAEWKWWPGPEACSGTGAATAAGLASLLQGAKTAMPRCDVAVWIFLGLSMAGWNALISFALAIASAVAAFQRR